MEGGKQRMNGETIAGISLVVLASVFIFAANMSSVWAIVLPADYLIFAIGIGFIVIGVRSIAKTNSTRPPTEHSGHY